MSKIYLLFVVILFNSSETYSQTYNLTIHPNNKVASLVMSQDEFNYCNNGNIDYVKYTNFIYDNFQDSFDIICYILNNESIPLEIDYYGKSTNVSNDIKGIGQSLFNNSQLYGSQQRLKQIIVLTRLDLVLNGPMLHELAHNWANYGIKTSAFYDNQEDNDYRLHWGISGCGGQLGGFKQSTLIPNYEGKGNRYKATKNESSQAFGQFANGGNSVPYSNFELYLMGLISPDSIQIFDVFKQIKFFDMQSVFEADEKIVYDKEKIINAFGERIPSYLTSQKIFKILYVVLSPNPLTSDEQELVDNHVDIFTNPGSDEYFQSYNYFEATNGLAQLDCNNIDQYLKLTSNKISQLPNNKTLDIYPNPNNGKFNIKFTGINPGKYQIQIINVQGMIQFEKEVFIDSDKVIEEFKLINLPTGNYFVKVSNGTIFFTRKIILL